MYAPKHRECMKWPQGSSLMGDLDSNRGSEQTGQVPERAPSVQRCLLNSSSDMQALHDMQWKESTPKPLPCSKQEYYVSLSDAQIKRHKWGAEGVPPQHRLTLRQKLQKGQ